MAELEILAPNQRVDAPIYLEACAGAGKTFTIEHLVVRLLCHPDVTFRRRLDQIAVITFTRAAAGDLRRRLQRCMSSLLDLLKAGSALPPYLDQLNQSARAEAQRQLELALHSFDRAWIGTIHGFCSRLLRRFGTNLEDLVRASQDQQLPAAIEQEWILEFLRYGIPHAEIGRGQWICLYRHFKSAPKLVEALRKHSPRSVRIPPWDQMAEGLLASLKRCPVTDSEQLQGLWMTVAAGYTGVADRQGLIHPVWIERSRRFAEQISMGTLEACDLLVREGCPWLEPFSEERRRRKMGDWSPSGPAQQVLKWVREDLAPLLENARHPGYLLSRIQQLLEPCYQRWLAEAGCSQPDRLIERVVSCAGSQDWCLKVSQELRTLIVDEFQDTDPQQWAIFRALKPHLQLVLVGDPKQSIYAFREADLYTYLEASKAFQEQERWTLTRCYRSSRPVIEAINHCLEALEGMDLPKLGERLQLSRTLAREEPPLPLPLPGLVWSIFEQGSSRGRWPSRKTLEVRILPALCGQILTLVEQGVQWSQIAVVVRDRYQAAQVADALASLGLPSHTARGRSWSERRALPVLRDLIEVLCHPDDEAALVRLLASPLAGWGPEALRCWRLQPLLGQIREDLLLMQGLLMHEGLMAAVKVLSDVHWNVAALPPKQQLEHGELVRDLLLLAEGLSALEQEDRSLGLLWPWTLQEVIAGRVLLPEEAAPAPPQAVQIMTIHMSKGLEFEAVFALGLCSRTPQESSEDPAEADAEKLRQLYVALTRAKRFLWVPMVIDTSGKRPVLGECAPIELLLARLLSRHAGAIRRPLQDELELLGQGGREVFESWILQSEPGTMGLQTSSEQRPLLPVELAVASELPPDALPAWPGLSIWSSFTAEAQPQRSQGAIADRTATASLTMEKEAGERPGEPQTGVHPGFLKGKAFGIMWHEWMQTRITRSEPLPRSYLTAHLISTSGGLSPSEEDLHRASSWIERCMDLPLWKGCSLNQVALSKRRAEVSFLLADRSRALKGWKGSIDVVAECNGDLVAIDWKTHDLGDHPDCYQPEALWRCLEEGDYLIQARLYLAALKAAGWSGNTGTRVFIFAFVRGIEKGVSATVCLTEEQLLGPR